MILTFSYLSLEMRAMAALTYTHTLLLTYSFFAARWKYNQRNYCYYATFVILWNSDLEAVSSIHTYMWDYGSNSKSWNYIHPHSADTQIHIHFMAFSDYKLMLFHSSFSLWWNAEKSVLSLFSIIFFFGLKSFYDRLPCSVDCMP